MNSSLLIPPARVVFTAADINSICELVGGSLRTGVLTRGPIGKQLEQRFAELCRTRYAAAVSSGTSALEIALRALEVAGGEVIVPANTCYATAGAVMHAGAKLRLADIERQTLALDPMDLERRLNENTRAVVLVHIGGVISPHTPLIVELCSKRGIPVVEGAAHAVGSTLNGQAAGSFGTAAAFSLSAANIITSCEGGVLVTNDERVDREARTSRDQGKADFTQNFHTRLCHNWRMSEPHAAIGLTHLRHLPRFVEERNQIARRYDAGIADCPSVTPLAVPNACRSNFDKYIALLPLGTDRSSVKQRLRAEFGVGLSDEVYEAPLHWQPIFAGAAERGSLPVAEELCARQVCLPVYQGMTLADINLVVTALHKVIAC